jgi:UrcA family protein
MYRKLILAAAVAALAAPALAQTTVKVSVAGLDAKAARARIWNAAKVACRAEQAGLPDALKVYTYMPCVEKAAANAEKSATMLDRDTASSQSHTLAAVQQTGR